MHSKLVSGLEGGGCGPGFEGGAGSRARLSSGRDSGLERAVAGVTWSPPLMADRDPASEEQRAVVRTHDASSPLGGDVW